VNHGDELRLGQLAALLRVVVADTGSTVTEMSIGHEIETIDDT
jgi:hypothetical protein